MRRRYSTPTSFINIEIHIITSKHLYKLSNDGYIMGNNKCGYRLIVICPVIERIRILGSLGFWCSRNTYRTDLKYRIMRTDYCIIPCRNAGFRYTSVGRIVRHDCYGIHVKSASEISIDGHIGFDSSRTLIIPWFKYISILCSILGRGCNNWNISDSQNVVGCGNLTCGNRRERWFRYSSVTGIGRYIYCDIVGNCFTSEIGINRITAYNGIVSRDITPWIETVPVHRGICRSRCSNRISICPIIYGKNIIGYGNGRTIWNSHTAPRNRSVLCIIRNELDGTLFNNLGEISHDIGVRGNLRTGITPIVEFISMTRSRLGRCCSNGCWTVYWTECQGIIGYTNSRPIRNR